MNDRLLLAVSGGVDSMALCSLCREAGFIFSIAHCNFGLRGEESRRDETFVERLGEQYGVETFLKRFDTEKYAAGQRLSTQEAARKLRYAWFEELIDGFSAPAWILTAHHADDNVETMLMHFFRGTGIQGLRGMQARQGRLVRPLLPFRKEELRQYAVAKGLACVEDSSNISDKYTRNYFRNRVIPLVQEIYPEAEQNLLANLARFSDIGLLYRQAIDLHKKKLLEPRGTEVHIALRKLLKAQPLSTILYEIVASFGFTAGQLNEVMRLLGSDSGKYVSSSTHRIIRNRNWLIIAPLVREEAQHVIIEADDEEVRFRNGSLFIEHLELAPDKVFRFPNSPLIAHVDAGELHYPLLLRKWRAGDYFYPLGMKKKKKLARFFIDQKLSATEKENIWVLEMDKKIVWITGHRIDERFRLTPSTKQALQIRWEPVHNRPM